MSHRLHLRVHPAPAYPQASIASIPAMPQVPQPGCVIESSAERLAETYSGM